MKLELKELIRAQVREAIKETLAEATAEVLREELGTVATHIHGPAAAPTPPSLPKATKQQRYTTGCFVRVNSHYRGSVGAAGSRTAEVYEVIRQHLGPKPMIRRQLMVELATLMPFMTRGAITSQVSRLLDGGALVVHSPSVGDAT